ncbi:CLUMA_CG008554, isoform A [Clunio marinus]|uniref:CLUMA_CG008554, isoform A n=1 Tax=Clunio marinus TaxID=568069 RepID=A0A1J1I668_9DIPT|nr:CLUMA_CG008554, isoform A [Clunio marinus]
MGDYSNDLVLLERVLLKLGLADTDEQLEMQLNKFLGPVLLKIVSPSEDVRKKVMEILTHVNKRLKSRGEVKLDLIPLLKHYQESSNSFLINFAIIYITLGFPRLDIQKQTELVSVILNCLEGKPEVHQNKLLMLILPLLGELKFPENPEERKTLFGLSERPNTKQHLLSILLDVLLLPYGFIESEVPSGMSSYNFKRVCLENKKAEYLETMKKGIVRFLDCGVFDDTEIVPHLIVASADTRFSVATPALNELNKICTSLDWFDAKMTAPLYILFSGNGSKVPERKTSPCSTRVKQKILQHLLKCRGNAINVAKGIQVIFEGLFGGESTNQKCKVAALQFATNLISYGQKDLIEKLSKVLQTYITKLIGSESSEPIDVQNAAYNAIAKLIATCPESFNKDVNLIVDYFNHLNASTPDMHNTIREVLVALAQAFKWDPSKQKDEPMELDDEGKFEQKKFNEKFSPSSSHLLILGVLQEQAESRLPIAQNVASLFLTTCFPSYFVPARYLLLVLCGTSAQLRETIYGYLYGSQRKDHINYSKLISCDHVGDDADEKELLIDQMIILPGFKPMIYHIEKIAEKKLSSASERATYNNHKLAFNLDIFTELLEYLRVCLWFSAGCSSEPGTDNQMSMLSDFITQLNDCGNIEHIEKFMKLIRNVLVAKKGIVELSCLSDLLTAAPTIITKNNHDLRSSLSNSLREVNETTRTLIARIYGILLAYGTDEKNFNDEIKNLANVSQKSLEYQHGSVLALSNGFYHRIINLRKTEDDMGLAQLISSSELSDSINYLVKLLTDQKALLTLAAIKGISLIGCSTELPLEEINDDEDSSKDKMEVDEPQNTKNYVFKTIFHLLKSSQTKQKIREDSAHCLGHLSIGDSKFFAKKTINGFLDLKRSTKDAAIHIAIAQGLVFVVAGDENLPKEVHCKEDDEMLRNLVSELVKIVPEVNVCSRQAVALWLLAVVKACSQRKPVLEKKRILQMAFTNLLSEENELVQDVASRGLGLIFSISNESDQSELSNILLDQLTAGNKGKVRQVTDDTQLFEEGVLGKTPTGGNLTTYKELCSLASDLNQPEIIYSFMQLANNNASWNSRLGAAFGLKSISGIAKTKMQPYLSKIVPRLFRYKYDPTPKIQNSMISIWDSVVIDNKETIELYYWEILEDITTNLTHSEWRTRIACCLAIRDLIKRSSGLRLRSREPSQSTDEKMEVDGNVPEPELKKLWSQLYRVMDDIHEGTREAAEGTAKLLAKICVVSVSCDHGKSGANVSASILPFLLETGVTHTVKEIRELSLKTVSEMIDSSGQLIHPHLSSLIPCLLKATGELDSSKLSMLSTMVSAQSGTQEAVDSARAEMAKSHYTMETLNKCIKYIDYSTLEKTTPAVLDLIKTSVILGTKIATAHFVCLISIHLSKDMTPLVGKYLSACVTALSDRNTVVRKYYATAIGHLIGNAKDTTVVSLFKKLNSMYFEDQSGKSRSIVLTLSAINKKHADIIKDYSSSIMPLIFFAKHEEINEDNKSTVEMWQELWNDVSFGDSMLQLYFNDIVAVLESSLNSQSWLLKAQSGCSIKTIAKRLETSLKEEDRIRLTELALSNVSGRTFYGKERLVEALAALSSKSSSKELNNRIIEAVLKECRKEEEVYKTKVLKCLGDVLETLDEENRFEDVYNIVWDLLDKQTLSSKDDEAGSSNTFNEERNKQKVLLINLKEVVCETLGKSWPSLKAVNSMETQEKYQLMLIIKLTECLKVNTRPIQKSLLVALGLFLEKLHLLSSESVVKEENLLKICDLVMVNVAEASVVPHTGLKKEALQAYLILLKKLKAKDKKDELKFIKGKFEGILINFQKDSSPEIKLRLQDISDQLKGI